MSNKDSVFSVALFVAIVVVAITSLQNNSELYDTIAQALTLPLLLVSGVNAVMSIPVKVITIM